MNAKLNANKSNLVLIGMSGAGKSTIGVLLAKTLGMGFIDTDIIIQQRAGKTLQSILDDDGIDTFLHLEEEAVCSLRAENCVIATGGSVIYSAAAMDALHEDGTLIYLRVPFSELERRLTNVASRGIVMRPGESLRSVFLEREPLYEKYCDIAVDCSGADVERCVAAVADAAVRRL
jgi:shikimate kinase